MRYSLRAALAATLVLDTGFALAVTPPPTASSGLMESYLFGFDTTNGLPRAVAVDASGEIYCNNCSGGGGGGGGAVTAVSGAFVDGALVTEGSKSDAAWGLSGAGSEIQIEKEIALLLNGGIGVTGTFWQATQPISAASLPLPSGAATAAGLTTVNTTLGSPFQAGGSIGNTGFNVTGTLPAFAVTPTVNLGTLNGASTAAKQPALGTAGAASADVISIQGVASMTAVKVDGSGVTQPVSAASLPLPSGAATSANQVVPTAAGTGGANAMSIQGIASGVAVPISSSGNLPTYLQAVSSGGATTFRAINAAASTMSGNIKSGSGHVFGFTLSNGGTQGVVCARIFAATSVTVGSGTPVISLCANTLTTASLPPLDLGRVVSTGISYDVTAGTTDTDTSTITTAGTVHFDLDYK